MNNTRASSKHGGILILPRLRVQNANAISSPMTWGFPAMSAFLGAMTALERRLGPNAGVEFHRVGVVCHGHEAQVTRSGYTRAFRLTRNPVLADGSTASIVEEGRIHLDITLFFDVQFADVHHDPDARQALANLVASTVEGMRIAGGSVMPRLDGTHRRPELHDLKSEDDQKALFRKLVRQSLPGYALVLRNDLLHARHQELLAQQPEASLLDAWLDLSRLNHHAEQTVDEHGEIRTNWAPTRKPGWIVPIPVGYGALSAPHLGGTVSGARDAQTPLRFVETLWSMGQWISPHRLSRWDQLLWEAATDGPDHAPHAYRCHNVYGESLIDRPQG